MPSGTHRIYMDADTIEFGEECSECLRWFVRIRDDDKCPHCLKHGCPPNPNRIRYLAVKNGLSLREIGRKADLTWRAMRRISQGAVAPRKSTERRILKAIGMPLYKKNIRFVFPFSRHV